MTGKASEKIIEGISTLLDGFSDLEELISKDFAGKKDSDSETQSEIEEAIVTEVRAAVETVLEDENYSPGYLASLISAMTEALEEIDPEVFEGDKGDLDEDDEDDDLDDDDDDLDYDDEDDLLDDE